MSSLFSKTNKTKVRFFNPTGKSSAEDASADSGRIRTSGTGTNGGMYSPINSAYPHQLSHNRLRFIRPPESLDDKLASLLRNIEKYGNYTNKYFKELLEFFAINPALINHIPKNFYSNALDVVIKLGDFSAADQLIAIKAYPSPEKYKLLPISTIERLFRSSQSREKSSSLR